MAGIVGKAYDCGREMGALFSRTTNVANGLANGYIWAQVYTDKSKGDDVQASLDQLAKVVLDIDARSQKADDICKRNSFIRIKCGECWGFYMDAALDSTVFVSVILYTGEMTIHNYPLQVNRNIIVDKKGYAVEAAFEKGAFKSLFGKGEIWEDKFGNDHQP